MPGPLRRFAVLAAFVVTTLVLTTVPATARTPWWWPRPTPTPTPTKTTATPTPTKTTVTPTPTPTPTPTQTQPPAPTCGGQQTLPNPAGGNWVCTWNDEFNGTSVDTSKWMVQTTAGSGFTDGTACYVDNPNNVSESGGYLNLTARKEAAPTTCQSPYGNFTSQYTSGEVLSYSKFAQMYGRFEVRAKFPASTVQGLQESLWMYASDLNKYGRWPASGEIDIAEVYSLYNDRAIPFVHYNMATLDYNVTNNYCTLDPTQFHTYTLVWTATTIQVSFDGTVCISDTPNPLAPLVSPAPFDQPFGLALTQALGIGKNAFIPGTTPLPATTQIDYMRVWQ